MTSRSITSKRFAIVLASVVFLPLLVAVGLSTVWVLSNDIALHRAATVAGERAYVKIQAEVLGELTDRLVTDLAFVAALAEEPKPAPVLRAFVATNDRYDQVRYLDQRGMETLRVNRTDDGSTLVPNDQLQYKGDRYYFEDAHRLEPGTVYFSPLDLNIENGEIEKPYKPMIRAAVAIPGTTPETHGLAIMNYRAQELLDQIAALAALSRGSVAFINNSGDFFLGAPNGENWDFMFPDAEDASFSSLYPEGWAAIRTQRGEGTGGQVYVDGRLFSFEPVTPLARSDARIASSVGSAQAFSRETAAQDVESYRWYIVSISRPDELYGRYSRRGWILGAGGLIALLLAAGAFATYRVLEGNRRTTERISHLLEEKETILKEVHHRIKNDMAIVAGLLWLHADRVETQEGKGALKEAYERVQLMSEIYDTLYRSEDVEHVQLGAVLETVSRQVGQGYNPGAVEVSTDLDRQPVSRKIAVPLSICTAELLTNAAKYGTDSGGALHLDLSLRVRDQSITVVLRDDGPGFPDAILTDPTNSTGFGQTMIDALISQLDGTVERRNDPGACITITVPSWSIGGT